MEWWSRGSRRAGWPARARRVSPPEPFKNWTEARQSGMDLARWWRDILAGIDRPPLYTWEDLDGWRWGPVVGDTAPGVIIDPPTLAYFNGCHARPSDNEGA